jgi:hypothetical protein
MNWINLAQSPVAVPRGRANEPSDFISNDEFLAFLATVSFSIWTVLHAFRT